MRLSTGFTQERSQGKTRRKVRRILLDSQRHGEPLQFLVMTNSQIDPVCRHCLGHGLARAVEIKDNTRIIRYECDTCHREWHVTNPAPTLGSGSVRVTIKPAF
jgi:hypothetical protein